ncbi:MAG TPA: glycosyltransferase, partial [Acidimicrobiia bacterium]
MRLSSLLHSERFRSIRPRKVTGYVAPQVDRTILYVIGTYPLLTTTFIDREIRELRDRGVEIDVVSIRRTERKLSSGQIDARGEVTYVLPAPARRVASANLRYLMTRPRRYFGTLWRLLSADHPSLELRMRTVLHFVMGVHVAALVEPRDPARVHAHFLDRATTVAIVVSRLLGIPYSATAHANDIYVDPVLLPEKVGWSDFVATCTAYNAEHLGSIADESKVRLIYHGLDLDSYHPRRELAGTRRTILAVGQLKEKKGFRYLVDACRILESGGYDFECEIIGEGPLRSRLEAQIQDLGLDDRVRLLGALDHQDVIEHMRGACVFALPSIVTADGDRDGIPNVILEAMAVGLPVVSTRVSAIPEVIIEGETGSLVEPRDPESLATALSILFTDDGLGRRLGAGGRLLVERRFDVHQNVAELQRNLEGSSE